MPSSPSVALVRDIYAKFAQRDLEAVLQGFAPDIEWTVAQGFPYAGTFVGGQAIVDNVFAKVDGDWDGFRHELHTWIDCGNEVLIVGTYHGTWKATGRGIEAPFVHFWTVEQGVVTRFRQYVDGPSTAVATDGFVHGAQA